MVEYYLILVLATSGLHSFTRTDKILLEQGDGDIILLDGIDSDSTDVVRCTTV